MSTNQRDLSDLILDYEEGGILTDEEVVELFQRLIDDGQLKHFAGTHYEATARQLIVAGKISSQSFKNQL